MDAGFLNFHGEEHFSTLDSSYLLQDRSGDDTRSYGETSNQECIWDWDNERELNGDVGLIPISGNTDGDFCFLSNSPPSKEDFYKIMCEWQHIINIEADTAADDLVYDNSTPPENDEKLFNRNDLTNIMIDNAKSEDTLSITEKSWLHNTSRNAYEKTDIVSELEEVSLIHKSNNVDSGNNRTELQNIDPMSHLFNKCFDLTTYVNEQKRPSGPGPGGKKIDMKNQRYVISADEDDHVDVETIPESNDGINCKFEDFFKVTSSVAPVEHYNNTSEPLESSVIGNCNESKPKIILPSRMNAECPLSFRESNLFNLSISSEISEHQSIISSSINQVDSEYQSSHLTSDRKSRIIPELTISPVIQAGDLNSLLEQFEATECKSQQIQNSFCESENQITQIDAAENKKDALKSKQILEALPQELIKRIKQSSKRKSISVIPAIPNKKRGKIVPASSEVVFLDHDYCTSANSSKKDSGFSSCEEDERSVLRNQPTVKTADGKLMVSLLKVNTIKKRKINLEEYKQLRQGRSSSGSPAPFEDENARRLQKMRLQPIPPPNMEMKTLVSIGINTDQSWGRLQEIMGSSQVNFSLNSLITSLVEHLPQVTEEPILEHGEDKTVVHLDKNRLPIKTHHKYTQTVNHRRNSSSSSCSSRSSRSVSRSPSPRRRRLDSERTREVEERRVIYVGRIENFITRDDLRKRFQQFGPINKISVHFRQTGDNYGFVTFKYKEDAYEAVEHGNDDPSLPHYDLSFGGRRIFCQANYSDLDSVHDQNIYTLPQVNKEETFDVLLREARAKLLRNKKIL